MAVPDARVPQSVDPEVSANLTRLLQIRGPLGVLNVLDTIVPIVSLGNVVNPTVDILQPSFRSTDVFSAGSQAAPPVNAILADTGALAAGTYDMMLLGSVVTTAGAGIKYQHRNAANTANLMEFTGEVDAGANVIFGGTERIVFAYEFAVNERFRILINTAGPVGSFFAFTIFARSR